jgi:drug/metabolite transporter (DMT)-like permease
MPATDTPETSAAKRFFRFARKYRLARKLDDDALEMASDPYGSEFAASHVEDIASSVVDLHLPEERLRIGDLLALLGAAGGAGYFLLGARLRATLSLRAYLLPVYATAALTLAVLAVLSGSALWVSSTREHAIFLALAAGPMVLGHGLLNWSLRYVPAWAVSASILAEPVSASALVLAVRGERPPWSAVAGALPVLVGLFLIATAARQKEPR